MDLAILQLFIAALLAGFAVLLLVALLSERPRRRGPARPARDLRAAHRPEDDR